MSTRYPTKREAMYHIDYCWVYKTTSSIVLVSEDVHGYPLFIVRQRRRIGYRILIGCRWFTPEQARNHWNSVANFSCDTEEVSEERMARARAMLRWLPHLERRAAKLGWGR